MKANDLEHTSHDPGHHNLIMPSTDLGFIMEGHWPYHRLTMSSCTWVVRFTDFFVNRMARGQHVIIYTAVIRVHGWWRTN